MAHFRRNRSVENDPFAGRNVEIFTPLPSIHVRQQQQKKGVHERFGTSNSNNHNTPARQRCSSYIKPVENDHIEAPPVDVAPPPPPQTPPKKRGRGRPRKNASPVQAIPRNKNFRPYGEGPPAQQIPRNNNFRPYGEEVVRPSPPPQSTPRNNNSHQYGEAVDENRQSPPPAQPISRNNNFHPYDEVVNDNHQSPPPLRSPARSRSQPRKSFIPSPSPPRSRKRPRTSFSPSPPHSLPRNRSRPRKSFSPSPSPRSRSRHRKSFSRSPSPPRNRRRPRRSFSPSPSPQPEARDRGRQRKEAESPRDDRHFVNDQLIARDPCIGKMVMKLYSGRSASATFAPNIFSSDIVQTNENGMGAISNMISSIGNYIRQQRRH